MKQDTVLEVKNLQTYFYSSEGVAKAVDGVSFTLQKGETLGIVGESGCGKSMTSLSLLRLVPSPPGKIVNGEILLNNTDILKLSDEELRKIRGNKISMIFQEPMTSLNPVLSVGEQIAESIRLHQGLSRKEAWQKAVDMIRLVGIPAPEKRAKQEPYQLSGGMRQRIMIAMALACTPDVLIADEPTTALDVTIQAQIIDIIQNLQKQLGMSIIFITHDLGVVAEICDKIAVMYAGQVVEEGTTDSLFEKPLHPYTNGLIQSLPKLYEDQEELSTIHGTVPSPYHYPIGCRYAERCPFATELCLEKQPELLTIEPGKKVRCWMYSKEWQGATLMEEMTV
ncbi:ABC transporter ATP-binding protein [Lysinibacillus fusiformis]|jgi:peptide/nickel transport system ATP-binding protein/oligopeptide transport system ATP-binding protein|uniref:ABC transporter ATP-binding protein n=1 Tax=Lysinibacillus TaxID=400634 RepID=UPI0004D38E55|nr:MULTISPECIES: ABC transporter ATP-binding protein [Lysinibacillus]AJK86738.1 peptide ABC transporter ATP-binding protein [Lysinibacillus fusiformis]KAB0443104.1 ABC transporter ATP-binding protein [Lysinibacillus fusiformis]KEK13114.1 peptide ABC transporter ATP-binding protein [Lysinibacillus sphaericus]KGA81604.1 peptide ABC transporter ATP-binding protein [Lysinibacillus fusiformis]MCE4044975.1 ABC transporter ATP-binding protein [Lysinibacillus fusiformis]